jgi:hypothetical protein
LATVPADWTDVVAPDPFVVIHGGTFRIVRDLSGKIRGLVNGWNDRAHPLVWTKPADQIITKPTVRRL